MNQEIKQNVIKGLGLDALPEDKQEEALETVGKIIFQNIIVRALDELSESDQDALEKLLSTGQADGDEISSFLGSKIQNFDSIVEDEVAKFRDEAADFLEKVGEAGPKV